MDTGRSVYVVKSTISGNLTVTGSLKKGYDLASEYLKKKQVESANKMRHYQDLAAFFRLTEEDEFTIYESEGEKISVELQSYNKLKTAS